MTSRTALMAGALLALTGVALGAFGAHALRARLDPRDLETYETAVRYQLYHALALLTLPVVLERAGGLAGTAGWLLLAGTLVFSGTLYVLVLAQQRWMGAVTPVGGVLLLAGWACVLIAAARMPRP